MEQARAEARRGFVCAISALGVLFVITLIIQAPRGFGAPIGGNPTYVAAWAAWPQGWSLFADGEYAPELVAYSHGPHGWRSGQLGPQVQGHNLWGLRRAQRLQAHEIESINDLIPPASWRPCGGRVIEDCVATGASGAAVAAVGPTLTIDSPALDPTLCGDVALTRQTLERWGARTADRWRIDQSVVVEVRCR